MKWFSWKVVFGILVYIAVYAAFGVAIYPRDSQGKAKKESEAAVKILELYEVRVDSAKREKKAGQRKLLRAQSRLERLKSLHGSSAVSLRELLDAERDVAMFAAEIEADDNAIREAELHLDLMRLGIDHGEVNLDDLRLPTELIRKH